MGKRLTTTARDRRKQRAGKLLADQGIRPQTRARYLTGLLTVLPLLESDPSNIDDVLAEYIQEAYSEGATLGSVGDMLCGVQHYLPWLKGKLQSPWKLFQIWKRTETVQQATPFPHSVLHALVFRAVEMGSLRLAALMAAGFFGLLRTGELLSLRTSNVMLDSKTLCINLGLTKTGFRQGVEEIVLIRNPRCLLLWKTLLDILGRQDTVIWSGTGTEFRQAFDSLLTFFNIHNYGFRPYSMRRGGATFLFKSTSNMEQVLIAGRWKSSTSAKNYINLGMATLTTMKFSSATVKLLSTYAAKFAAPT